MPDEGQIFLNEKIIKLNSPIDAKKNKIGMVFQHFNLFETLSVFENLIIDSNETRENLREKIEDKYGKRPINIFYDQVGGEPYEEGLRLLSSEGKALIVGFASGNIPNQLLSYLLVKNITIMGVFMISFEDDDSAYLHSRMESLFNLYLDKKIDPVYETIPFEKIVDYLDLIGSRKTIGRIVATI